MRLIELNPGWVSHGGDGVWRIGDDGEKQLIPERLKIGVGFDCPCGCADRAYILFANPVDGGPPVQDGWTRTGETFESMTLHPSIQRVGGCEWHGWIRNGELVEA